MRTDRAGARLPAGQLPVDRRAHSGDAAAHQRLQPARHQRARAATSGTTSRRRPTRSLPSVGTVTLHDPFTGEPLPYAMPARRARLYARAVADQRLVDRALPAQQHASARSTTDPSVAGAHAGRSTPRSSRCCGRRSASATRCSATRSPASSTAPPSAATVTIPAGFVPEALQPLQGRLHRWFPWLVDAGRRHRARPDPEGRAGRPARQPQAARREQTASARRPRMCATSASCCQAASSTCSSAPADATDDELREHFANLARRRCWS